MFKKYINAMINMTLYLEKDLALANEGDGC